MLFLLKNLQHTKNNFSFIWDCVIFTFWNNVIAEFNKYFLIKLSSEVYTYNFVDNVNVNENKTDYIPQQFLQS